MNNIINDELLEKVKKAHPGGWTLDDTKFCPSIYMEEDEEGKRISGDDYIHIRYEEHKYKVIYPCFIETFDNVDSLLKDLKQYYKN